MYEKREVIHSEIKDGLKVFVKGPKPNPYKDVNCSSLSLGARIESGVFEEHEGIPHKLEKANGSDIMTAQIEKEQNKMESAKETAARRKHAQEIYDKVFNKEKDEKENSQDN